MGMVTKDALDSHLEADVELARLEREYRQCGREAAARHVHGARVLLEKARRLADAPVMAIYMLN